MGDEHETTQPPPDLRRRAHVAGNGELLWPRGAASDVAIWAASRGFGIWGGEVFAPRGPFTAMMIRDWQTRPEWRAGERWQGFVERALRQALGALQADDGPREEGLLYFLAYAPESAFATESRLTRAGDRRLLEISKQEAESDG